jgi:hypothetical protein
MRTFRERLRGYVLDIASRTVYNAEQGLVPTGGRQDNLWLASSTTCSETYKGRYPSTFKSTQQCVKLAQTSQRKQSNDCSMLTRLRKGILNSLVMRKVSALKEKQYGKN